MSAKGIARNLLEDEDFPDPKDEADRLLDAKEWRLMSTRLVHVPGLVQMARAQFNSQNPRDKQIARKILRCFEDPTTGEPAIPDDIIDGVLSGKIPYTVDGTDIVIKHARF